MRNVLFVCLGNSCRSQMAEGFGRAYGSDVMQVWSAGLAPAEIVQPLTIAVMLEKNIDIDSQFPKNIRELEWSAFDVVVNMSGFPLPVEMMNLNILAWNVEDPMNQSDEVYRAVRDQLEGLVMQLIMDIRRVDAPKPVPTRPQTYRPPAPAAPPSAPAPPPVAPPSPAQPVRPRPAMAKRAETNPQAAKQAADQKRKTPPPAHDSSRYRLGRVRAKHDNKDR